MLSHCPVAAKTPREFRAHCSGCNRSKQAANLRVARVLAKFDQIHLKA